MKTVFLSATLFGVFQLAGLHAAEVRYGDVVYLDDWKQPPLHLKVLRRAPLFPSRDSARVGRFVKPGQLVKVIGLGEFEHFVSVRVAIGSAKGWIAADALVEPSPQFLAKLDEQRRKMELHRELIERHEVVEGMTRAEVRASLGKPEKTARRRTELGPEEQWFYSTYQYLPQYTQQEGRPMVSYRRTPAGQKIVTFSGDEVVEVADDQAMETKPPVRGVPPARVAQ